MKRPTRDGAIENIIYILLMLYKIGSLSTISQKKARKHHHSKSYLHRKKCKELSYYCHPVIRNNLHR